MATSYKWSLKEWVRAEAIIYGWNTGELLDMSVQYPDLQAVVVDALQDAERLIAVAALAGKPAEWPKVLTSQSNSVGGHERDARAAGVLVPYLAMQQAVRQIYRSSRPAVAPAMSLAVQQSQLAPWALVLAVTGIGAAAVVAWKAVDGWADVQRAEAVTLAQTDAYLRDVQLRISKGQPVPTTHPPWIDALAQRASVGPWLIGGTAVLAAGVGVAGAVMVQRQQRQRPAAATNPRRSAPRRARRRQNPAPNPLKPGYSQPTVSANIADLQRAGYSPPQSAAIALRSARSSYREGHPTGAYPAHLQTRAERESRSNPAPKKAAPARRKQLVAAARRQARMVRTLGNRELDERTGATTPEEKALVWSTYVGARKGEPGRAARDWRTTGAPKKTASKKAAPKKTTTRTTTTRTTTTNPETRAAFIRRMTSARPNKRTLTRPQAEALWRGREARKKKTRRA